MNKRLARKSDDDLRPEYDLSQLKGRVRGKYYSRAKAGTNLILIEPDLAEAFPDTESVNRALRLLLDVARQSPAGACGRRRPARRSTRRRTAAHVTSV